ncbi:chaperonin 10-like protein [Bisporella sp. PMI_857]|nr:chaperonin 10-like protein [Bisporella sp. PMI_857]
MKAVVIHQPRGANVLKLDIQPIPIPLPGKALIRIKEFGLNRSELLTRQGHSPNVLFPRALGIDGVGIVEEPPSGELSKGDVIAMAIGGVGREFDGSYTCVCYSKMHQTAWSSLFCALQLQNGDRLLIRGGSTSSFVASTTRRAELRELLLTSASDVIIIGDGSIAGDVKKGKGFDKILELVGTATLEGSLQRANANGIVLCLTTYIGGSEDIIATPLEFHVQISRASKLDNTVEAHKFIEEDKAIGNIVVAMVN